jgi:hypothetical protein
LLIARNAEFAEERGEEEITEDTEKHGGHREDKLSLCDLYVFSVSSSLHSPRSSASSAFL